VIKKERINGMNKKAEKELWEIANKEYQEIEKRLRAIIKSYTIKKEKTNTS
jgi:hypothetical protein